MRKMKIPTEGPLEFTEGEMLTGTGDNRVPRKACWLTDTDGDVVAAVAVDADYGRSLVALRYAAHATQVLPDLLAACKALVAWHADVNGTGERLDELDDIAKAAIAKAEGSRP